MKNETDKYTIYWHRYDKTPCPEMLKCHGLTMKRLFQRLRGALKHNDIVIYSIEKERKQ